MDQGALANIEYKPVTLKLVEKRLFEHALDPNTDTKVLKNLYSILDQHERRALESRRLDLREREIILKEPPLPRAKDPTEVHEKRWDEWGMPQASRAAFRKEIPDDMARQEAIRNLGHNPNPAHKIPPPIPGSARVPRASEGVPPEQSSATAPPETATQVETASGRCPPEAPSISTDLAASSATDPLSLVKGEGPDGVQQSAPAESVNDPNSNRGSNPFPFTPSIIEPSSWEPDLHAAAQKQIDEHEAFMNEPPIRMNDPRPLWVQNPALMKDFDMKVALSDPADDPVEAGDWLGESARPACSKPGPSTLFETKSTTADRHFPLPS